MQNLAAERDLAVLEEFASRRHRAVASASFPGERPTITLEAEALEADESARGDRDERELIEHLTLLAGALTPLARMTGDAVARAIADDAREWFQGPLTNPNADVANLLVRLEDALERIAATTNDEEIRDFAEDTLALYRGR
jgi:hypothetical protein